MQLPEGQCPVPLASVGWGCLTVRKGERKRRSTLKFVFEEDFMVKLLRACVWMPWRKQAMKDVVSYDKLREDANSL